MNSFSQNVEQKGEKAENCQIGYSPKLVISGKSSGTGITQFGAAAGDFAQVRKDAIKKGKWGQGRTVSETNV